MVSIVLALAFILTACAPQTPAGISPTDQPSPSEPPISSTEIVPQSEGPLTLVDDMGRTITLAAPPKRVVSTAASITEILFAIGAGDLVVGRDDFSVYPAQALEVQSFGSLWGDFPAEAILAMEPDLVIAAEILSEDQVLALEGLGLNVYWQSNPVSFDDLYANIEEIAMVVGRPDAGLELVAQLETRVSEVTDAVAGIETRPAVFYELDATDPSNPWTAGSGTFVDTIISMAGGTNAASELNGAFAQLSLEALITIDPDFIILGDADFGVTPEQLATRGGWGQIAAVANGNVFPIDSNWMSVPGPRLVDGLEAVARMLHPELFE